MLNGKAALVSGGDPALLGEVVEALSQAGAHVLVLSPAGPPPAGMAETVRHLSLTPKLALDAEALSQAIRALCGGVDIVITMPQRPRAGAFLDLQPESWEAGIGSELEQGFLASRAAVPHMLAAGAGALVHIVPSECVAPQDGMAIPAMLGLAMVGLSKSIALDFAGQGIRSNCVAWDRRTPPGAAVRMALLLASEQGRAINAQVLLATDTEMHLLDQPRPVRILHRDGGWSADTLAATLPDRWADALSPLQGALAGVSGQATEAGA
jgi:NAD(P)-dependent dehydrogenase (short-subunit alcohol dehydrogenase family)